MFGRPNLYTSYADEAKMLPTWTQKGLMAIFVVLLVLMPFNLPVINQIPFFRFLGDEVWLRPLALVLVLIPASLGLNLLSGVAGQVSLGHAFFMGVGATTAAYLGGQAGSNVWGHGLPIWIWLPGAGVAAALIGMLVAPVAVRLRGLYLAIVTLGLVFLGIHMGNTDWGRKLAGAPGLGRSAPELDLRVWKEEKPLVNVSDGGHWLWFDVTDNQKRYFVLLAIAAFFVVISKNIVRSRTGRALQAIRDRDIAAEVMGVPEFKYKTIAFAISSFFAGVSGALFAALSGQMLATEYNLTLSVEFIAILLIGGAGTTAGTLIGTFFVLMIPQFVESFTQWLDARSGSGGITGAISEFVLTDGDDFGVINTGVQTPGWQLNVFDWNIVLFGLLIIVFLIFEPLGLFGLWVRVRNYWKGWPFSY